MTERAKWARTIGTDQRAEIAEMISEARKSRGWSRQQVSRAANRLLSTPAVVSELRAAGLRGSEIKPNHVATLDGSSTHAPMGNDLRRVRLLGIVLALDLDRARVNLLGGGI